MARREPNFIDAGELARRSYGANSSPERHRGVLSLKGSAKHLDEAIYCGRGQGGNLIKLHKAPLASDRTSCRPPTPIGCDDLAHDRHALPVTLDATAPKRSSWRAAKFTSCVCG